MGDSISDEELFTLGLYAAALHKMIKKKKRYWTKDWLLKREKLSHLNLLKELRTCPGDFYNYWRMDEATFNLLLMRITPATKSKTHASRDTVFIYVGYKVYFSHVLILIIAYYNHQSHRIALSLSSFYHGYCLIINTLAYH